MSGAGAVTVAPVTDLHTSQQARGSAKPPAADVVAIGEVTVTPDSVLLPLGRFPLAGTTWTVRDSTRIVTTTRPYARVLAIVFAVTLVGLLFLLIKDRHYGGAVLVTVVGEGLYHSVEFPPGPDSTAHVVSLVNRARSLAAAATWAAAESPEIDA
jgi:hypothetical protein